MPEKPPLQHIAFILDGNRRWAAREGLSSLEGHKAGYKNLKVIAQACFDKGIKYFSCYLFSNENWQRSQEEVGYLMNLALRVVLKDAKELNSKNVRLKIIGSRLGLDKKLLQAIEKAEELTASNTAGTLVACFNYGGQQEIVEATKSIVSSGLPAEEITEETKPYQKPKKTKNFIINYGLPVMGGVLGYYIAKKTEADEKKMIGFVLFFGLLGFLPRYLYNK